MRFQTFTRRILSDGSTEVLEFTPDHYREAGVGYSPAVGMPQLEAYQLVNRWNHNSRFVYTL